MKNLYYIMLFLIILLIIVIKNKYEFFITNPCAYKLSDNDYLTHMIPHHQVAIDISIELQKKTKNPGMQEILRKLIWTQDYEILIMKQMLKNLPDNVSSSDKLNRSYIATISDYIFPNKLGLTQAYCEPHFFDPEAHKEHLKHMVLDDISYIEHMIPHHQVAVDMSKKLLKHTKNDFMIYLAYRIIRAQQSEIVLLNDLKKKINYRHQSELVIE